MSPAFPVHVDFRARKARVLLRLFKHGDMASTRANMGSSSLEKNQMGRSTGR